MKNIYAVIMAGGVGTRFWPKSRQKIPKQYLDLAGKDTMIQMAAKRLCQLVPKNQLYIVSTKDQALLLKSQLSWLPTSNIIFEPFGKNTAPCIGLSAIHLYHHFPDAVMIILPADHLISNSPKFLSILEQGVALAQDHSDALITIGIQPTFPATGYGYIQRGKKISGADSKAYKVRAFAEKPTQDVADTFFASGEFLWNSGIFIWRAKTVLDYIEQLMPDLYQGLCQIEEAIGTPRLDKVTETVYKQIYSESIDYGVMEHARHVLVLEGDFGWNDIGSWDAVYEMSEKCTKGNVVRGLPILKDVKNSYVEVNSDRVVSLVGVDDLIVVDTPDALLICKRNKSQDVKWVVEKLKHNGQKSHI